MCNIHKRLSLSHLELYLCLLNSFFDFKFYWSDLIFDQILLKFIFQMYIVKCKIQLINYFQKQRFFRVSAISYCVLFLRYEMGLLK